MNEYGSQQVRTHARFDGPPPAGMESMVREEEITAFLRRSEGPTELATYLHESLRERLDGVQDNIEGLSAHIGRFTVRRGRRAVGVLLTWFPLPQHRFWALAIFPRRSLGKRRREQDLTLAVEVRPHLDEILSDHPDISRIVWMTDDEAEAYTL